MAKLLNDAEMVVAVREGKRVRNHLNQVEVEIRADIVIWGDDKTPLWMYADGGPGRWELVEPEPPKTVEYWDAKLEPVDCVHPTPWFIRKSPRHVFSDWCLTRHVFSDWCLTDVNRWGDFRGFVWELVGGRIVHSALQVFQCPDNPDGCMTLCGNEAINWPLARLVAVRFQGRRPE